MSNQQLIKERTELLQEMSSLSLLLHGSWIQRFSTCTRTACKCHAGKKHGPRHYLVINENGYQRQKYIPNAFVKHAQEGLVQDKRLREIVERITQINLALMKEGKDESQ
jgi:hypothetical protein